MYSISKDFAFSASHQLDHLPEGHKCRNPHGHNYLVRVELTAPNLDGESFVVDYGRLDPIKAWIDKYLDHKNLNDFMRDYVGGQPSTAENLANVLYGLVRRTVGFTDLLSNPNVLLRVGVSETPNTWAWYWES